jgi:hypothetical protein
VPVHDLAENVRGLVAVEGGVEDLDLVVWLEMRPGPGSPLVQSAQKVVEIATDVRERPRPAEVVDDSLETAA